MSKVWAKDEVEYIVADYFKMLLSELYDGPQSLNSFNAKISSKSFYKKK